MPKSNNISMSVIKRMPRYYRFLGKLKDDGIIRISSRELSKMTGFTASQIRQDLNCFGGFGQQGYGYNILDLRHRREKATAKRPFDKKEIEKFCRILLMRR